MSSAAPLLSHLVPTQPGTRLSVEQTVDVIQEEVAIRKYAPPRQQPTEAPVVTGEDWGWELLRDYVVSGIEATIGVFPRQPAFKEKAIFQGFVTRYGPRRAAQIARYAFEVAGGYWKSAPISVNRFCANSDPYFGNPIAEHLDQVANVRT